jgi:hypothetical protein
MKNLQRQKYCRWMRQRPEVLQELRQQAVVQSAESSNRIEGYLLRSIV